MYLMTLDLDLAGAALQGDLGGTCPPVGEGVHPHRGI